MNKSAALFICSSMAFPLCAGAASYRPWVYERLTSRSGDPLCVISTASNEEDRIRNIAVKIFPRRQEVHLTAYLDTWNFQTGTKVPATLDFMDNNPINVTGFGDGKIVDLSLSGESSAGLFGGLIHGDFLQLGFPDGGGQTWTVPMPKNKSVIKKFFACAKPDA